MNPPSNKARKKGFTIIELMVIFAIIGILATIIIAFLADIRPRSRDAKRQAELNHFSSALEAFHLQFGVYPCGDGNSWSNPGHTVDTSYSEGFMNGSSLCSGTSMGLHSAGYINTSHPKDPLNRTGHYYIYETTADRQYYILAARLEKDPDRMANDGGFCSQLLEIGSGVGKIRLTDFSHPWGLAMPCN